MTSGLRELLSAPLEPSLGSSDACLEQARAVRDSYRRLARRRLGADRILELKFASLYWRRNLLERLQREPPSWLWTDHNTLTILVDALGTRLPEALTGRLTSRLDSRTRGYLMASQGTPTGVHPDLDRRAGPGVELNIRANRDSPWHFARWRCNPAFTRYELVDDGVMFRGVHFRPGDILLANVNIDGNGVYTTLSEPTRFSSHAAVFAMLEDEAGRYPAVIETYEKGVRAVPLNVFLGAGFCAYVEVYRHRDLDASHGERIGRAALELMREVDGYNFDSVSDDRRYVSCCTIGRLLHRDAGLEPACWQSRIQHPRIRANLEKLGYTFFDFFAPVDYLLDPKFECVGWVDNGQFQDLLARELVEGYFRELFMTRTLNVRKLPVMGRVNRWGIGHIRRRTLLGRLIGRVEGFDAASLPAGPDPLLAVIVLVEGQLGRAIKRTRGWLAGFEHAPAYFSLQAFSRLPAVRAHLRDSVRLPWLE